MQLRGPACIAVLIVGFQSKGLQEGFKLRLWIPETEHGPGAVHCATNRDVAEGI